MYTLRPFRNTDPPLLAEIWRHQPPQRGLAQPVNVALLEMCIFSKHFFDPQGFTVATYDGRPVGFSHAAFGPDESGNQLDYSLGTTQMLMLDPAHLDPVLADDLISASEAYQQAKGATVHYAGGIKPLNGFYLGLYGGSELPGILDSDPIQGEHFLRHGYEQASEVVVLQHELARYRVAAARDARRVRRETTLERTFVPKPPNWWEACLTGGQDRIRYSLVRRADHHEIASVTFWDIEPLATSWGIPTVGMLDLYVDPDQRQTKVATHLLNETLKLLQRRGANVVEAQTMGDNKAAISLYRSLGFTQVDRGQVLRRRAASA